MEVGVALNQEAGVRVEVAEEARVDSYCGLVGVVGRTDHRELGEAPLGSHRIWIYRKAIRSSARSEQHYRFECVQVFLVRLPKYQCY